LNERTACGEIEVDLDFERCSTSALDAGLVVSMSALDRRAGEVASVLPFLLELLVVTA